MKSCELDILDLAPVDVPDSVPLRALWQSQCGVILIVAFTFAGEDLSPNLNPTIR